MTCTSVCDWSCWINKWKQMEWDGWILWGVRTGEEQIPVTLLNLLLFYRIIADCWWCNSICEAHQAVQGMQWDQQMKTKTNMNCYYSMKKSDPLHSVWVHPRLSWTWGWVNYHVWVCEWHVNGTGTLGRWQFREISTVHLNLVYTLFLVKAQSSL